MVIDEPYGRNYGCGAAEAAFSEIGKFGGIHLAFFDLKAEVVLGNGHQRTPGDGRENGRRLRGNDFIVLRDEKEIGSAGFFDSGACRRVKVHVLVEAFLVGRDYSVEAHCVVESRLDVSGTVGRRAVEVADFQLERADAALEVRSDRRYENAELVFLSRFDADDGRTAEKVRADIERSSRTEGRNPGLVREHNLLNGFDEAVLGKGGHFEAGGGIGHALRVEVRAEGDDMAVGGGVRLEAFEAGLGVMENSCAFGEGDCRVSREGSCVPGPVAKVGNVSFVSLDVAEAEICPVKIFLFHFKAPSPKSMQ